MSVPQRLKVAMKGSREQRAVLVRDPDRVIAAAVLSSPKLAQTEIEAFARMANVSEDVLRTISMNRGWMRKLAVAAALVKNPKTPAAISLHLLPRIPSATSRTSRPIATCPKRSASTPRRCCSGSRTGRSSRLRPVAATGFGAKAWPWASAAWACLGRGACRRRRRRRASTPGASGQALHVDGGALAILFARQRLEQVDGLVEGVLDGRLRRLEIERLQTRQRLVDRHRARPDLAPIGAPTGAR